jgi:hypothetical protein
MYLQICGSFRPQKNWVHKSQIRKLQKRLVRKSQICKLPYLRKVYQSKKSAKFAKFADLKFAELSCGPPTPTAWKWGKKF